ncbi:MAG: prepilin-type N-terminal cleavage/methylation domain-containing protein [Proteobacteria bacterium]|nr:prepilin-type N-terminal cleavage/methylation domain-containing protein [Pseudomonadota bacterium]
MKHGSRGFTLIELMIALAILAVGLLGLIGMTTTAMSANKIARQFTEGLNLARDKAESLKRNNLYTINPNLTSASDTVVTGASVCTDSYYRCYHTDLENPSGDTSSDDLDIVSAQGTCNSTSSASDQADHCTVQTLSGEAFHVMWNIWDSQPRTDMKTVQVIVRWIDGSTQRTVTQRTIIVAKDLRFY